MKGDRVFVVDPPSISASISPINDRAAPDYGSTSIVAVIHRYPAREIAFARD
jgi:hypothetical protein